MARSAAGRSVDSLSHAVKVATQPQHDQAENAPFIKDLLSGKLGRDAYTSLVVQHYAFYQVLEQAVVNNTDPRIAPLLFPELARVESLRRDLEFLGRSDDDAQAAVLPSTAAYCDHLRFVGASSPALLAHHYVRYLGDLSGGQIVARLVRRHLGFEGVDGTRFYEFAEVPKPKRLKDSYRDLLDALDWDADDQDAFIAEAQVAFTMNGEILQELGRATAPVG